MTKRLYYEDSHIRSFSAEVVSCTVSENGYEVILDRTAFYPGGGGQRADSGTVNGIAVLNMLERGGDIIHVLGEPVSPGTAVTGEIDWEKRFRSMQNHTGEHIVSGLVHRLYGYENVGFHAGEDAVIIDFDGYLSPDEIKNIERLANEASARNLRVSAFCPEPERLSDFDYRSKLELTENVRLVEIDGVDLCACCAVHVSYTGEIGPIRLFNSIRRKDGVRIWMISGYDALDDYLEKADITSKVSALLSAAPSDIPGAVERIMTEKSALSFEIGGLKRYIIKMRTESRSYTDGNIVLFEPLFDTNDLRMLVTAVLPFCGGICAAFTGNDKDGYKYVMASSNINLREKAKEINSALSGRGGGQPEMIQGSVSAGKAEIKAYFNA